MANIILKVYEKDKKTVKKECKADTIDLEFGVVRRLMGLLDYKKLDNAALLSIIMDEWKDIVSILSETFPDMADDDWDHVKMKELIVVIKDIAITAVKDMLNIPTDPKN